MSPSYRALIVACIALIGPAVARAESRVSRVGVLVLTEDVEEAGTLQAALLQAIDEEPTLRGVGCEELAPHLAGVEDTQPPLIPMGEDALVGISAAVDAYYDVEFEVALRKLDETSSKIADAPATVRSRYYLWRTAALLALGRKDEAREEARNAVDANPNVRVDLSTYPKDVQDAVAAAKGQQRLLDFDLQVTNDVQIWLDGVSVSSAFKVSPGEHRLSLYAPKCLPVSRTEELRGGGKIRPPLIAALPASRRAALEKYVGLTSAQEESLAHEVAEWDVDIVVLGTIDGDTVRLTVYKPSVAGWTSTSVEGARAAGEWAVEHSVLAHKELEMFRPPPSIALGATEPQFNYDLMGGVSVRSQSVTLSQTDVVPLNVAGAQLAAHGMWRWPRGDASELGVDGTFALGTWPGGDTAIENRFGGPSVLARGGTSATLRVGGGYDLLLSRAQIALRPRLMTTAEFYGASHTGKDVSVAVFTPHFRASAGVGGIVEAVIANNLKAELNGAYYPVSFLKETGLSLGESARATETCVGVGLAYRVDRFLLGAQLSRSELDIQYQGVGSTRILPTPVDAHRSDVEWNALLTLRWIP